MTSSPLAFIGMAMREDEVLYNTEGYGVLDLGATETVGSLEAVENLMKLRAQVQGAEEQVEVFHGPSARKPFRFGNGGVQKQQLHPCAAEGWVPNVALGHVYFGCGESPHPDWNEDTASSWSGD